MGLRPRLAAGYLDPLALMAASTQRADEYESFYREFDSQLMRQVRAEAYGEDIGQHSWVDAAELREDSRRLCLGPTSRLLDLGSGPCLAMR